MFEEYTYESILSDVLERVSDSMDKREGSIIYDAVAPACAELAKAYIELERVLDEVFADTASREYLIKRASERGLYPKDEIKAVILADMEGNFELTEGARFNIDTMNYIYTGNMYNDYYMLECEEGGEQGNVTEENIIPIDYIEGLESAKNVGIAVYGEDEEDTEVFRQRYLESIQSQAFGGNVADYKQKVKALEGVGGVKVYRASEWNGAGTVKLVIQTSEYKAPTSAFISELQTAIDPLQNQGEGVGLAPIGHQVTVAGVNEVNADILAEITYADGYAFEDVSGSIAEVLSEYFEELNETWEDTDGIIIYKLQIGARLLNIEGILDVDVTEINSSSGNYQLGKDSIIDIEDCIFNNTNLSDM